MSKNLLFFTKKHQKPLNLALNSKIIIYPTLSYFLLKRASSKEFKPFEMIIERKSAGVRV